MIILTGWTRGIYKARPLQSAIKDSKAAPFKIRMPGQNVMPLNNLSVTGLSGI